MKLTKESAAAAAKIEQLFVWTGYSVISASGLYLAVMAHQVTRLDAWVVAYLMLIAGVAQNALGKGLVHLSGRVKYSTAVAIFSVFNIANLMVILGRFQAIAPLVFIGMTAILAIMLYAGWLARKAQRSPALIGYYVVLASVGSGSIAGAILTIVLH